MKDLLEGWVYGISKGKLVGWNKIILYVHFDVSSTIIYQYFSYMIPGLGKVESNLTTTAVMETTSRFVRGSPTEKKAFR